MRQRRLLRALSFGCAVLLSSSSWAATGTTVEPSLGAVLINNGTGFKQIKKPVKAKVGDSVMVSPDGAATIVYADGCRINVEPGTVSTVAQLSPCASGSRADNDRRDWCSWSSGGNCYVNTAVVGTTLGIFGWVLYNLAISP